MSARLKGLRNGQDMRSKEIKTGGRGGYTARCFPAKGRRNKMGEKEKIGVG